MSIWTREVKSIAAVLVHDILSGKYLGLLHKIENVCKHEKETVDVNLTFDFGTFKLNVNMLCAKWNRYTLGR